MASVSSARCGSDGGTSSRLLDEADEPTLLLPGHGGEALGESDGSCTGEGCACRGVIRECLSAYLVEALDSRVLRHMCFIPESDM